ncbi:MAG TPA: peptidoglycan-binding protein [Stellaceae bacterium]|jgi:GH25 family lysozyme M1 (1,4-beta-N-acetylmuramidase)|nr:peptidoglycan-binding protein [Stellaceae bacterium]
MTDWSGLVRGLDVSHYQKQPDWAQIAAAGYAYAVIKCSQGNTVDPMFDYNRRGAEANNIPWLPYVFLTPEDDDTTIANFLNAVGLASFPAALDWEMKGVSAAIMERWIAGTQTRTGRLPLAYYGIYPPDGLTAAIGQCPRWLPQYPASPTANSKLPPWDGQSAVADWSQCWFIWQWSSTATVPGMAAGVQVDLNRLACSLPVFQAWHATGTLPNAQAPAAGPVAPPPAQAADLGIGRTLQLHATGPDVIALQQRLAALGYAVPADGNFGPDTRLAVEEFQSAKGMNADGVVGQQTLNALES